jgi:hypothetical protein
MAKQIVFAEASRQAILRGVNLSPYVAHCRRF